MSNAHLLDPKYSAQRIYDYALLSFYTAEDPQSRSAWFIEQMHLEFASLAQTLGYRIEKIEASAMPSNEVIFARSIGRSPVVEKPEVA